jgi:hypothetical protein
VASKLVSAVAAGTAGGLLIGCTYPVMLILADILDKALSRPKGISSTLIPTSDQNLWIALLFLMLGVFVLVPVYLAVTGALTVRLSRVHLPDLKSCILVSYAAGLLAIGLGIVIFYYMNGLLTGPSYEDISLGSRVGNSTEQVIGWFTNPASIVIMLLAALVSPAGGAIYWMATKQEP